MLEGADRNDPVHLLVKRLPSLEPEIQPGPPARQRLATLMLIAAERQSNDVHPMVLVGAQGTAPPPAADVQQAMAALELAFTQRQLDLRDLRVGKRRFGRIELRA